MLMISEKLYLLPPKPAQGFTYWLRRNSLSCAQHDSHKPPGLCQQLVLVLVLGGCSAPWPAAFPAFPFPFGVVGHPAAPTAAIIHCSAGSEPLRGVCVH